MFPCLNLDPAAHTCSLPRAAKQGQELCLAFPVSLKQDHFGWLFFAKGKVKCNRWQTFSSSMLSRMCLTPSLNSCLLESVVGALRGETRPFRHHPKGLGCSDKTLLPS